ncbi:MAG: hypothetical protein WDO68_06915 [Gammaproteobacteria bacterium]
MSLFTFWTLFALASVVLAAGAPAIRHSLVGPLLIAGFGAGLVLFIGEWQVPPVVLAALIASLALIQLVGTPEGDLRQPRWYRIANGVALLGGGFIAAQGGAFLVSQGAPAMIAFPCCAMLPVLAAGLVALRPDFAPRKLRDEAALFLLASGICLAAVPEVLSGWTSAMVLNASARGEAATAIPVWVLVSVGAVALAGAASRRWRRN